MKDCSRREFVVQLGALIAGLSTARPHRAAAMMPRELDNLSAVEAVAAMRRGDIRAERFAQFCIDQWQALKRLNAFVTVDPETVLHAARRADQLRASGAALPPLHGLPIAIKDNIDTAGVATTAGTPALRNNRPHDDAKVLKSLYAGGAILFGKTNMHELALGYTTNNGAFGATHNPYDTTRIAGGSSGGTAAAISARITPAGLGTDTVGSVRVPAALCGIAGLRPSQERYPGVGIVPLSHTRDTAGPMARSIADLILLDSVITGDMSAVQPVPLKGLRLSVVRHYYWSALDGEVERIATASLAKLTEAGAEIVEVEVASLSVDAFKTQRCRSIQLFEMRSDLARYLAEHRAASFNDVMAAIASPTVKTIVDRFIIGSDAPTQAMYEQALRDYRPALQTAFANTFVQNRIDATIFPMTQIPALPIGEEAEFDVKGNKFPLRFLGRNADPGTCAGLPGIVLPAGLASGNLPVGIGLDAPARTDRRLLGIGLSIEQVLGRLPAPALS
jgi:Asp-tRNA(Asn)/Glu-tRNA(Gln) amidotransferase A subunit family amidase